MGSSTQKAANFGEKLWKTNSNNAIFAIARVRPIFGSRVTSKQAGCLSAPVAGQHWCKRRDIATAEHERQTDDNANHRTSLSSTKAIVLSKSIHDP
jgi:hypothetical protein